MKCGTKEDSIVTANGGKSEMRDKGSHYLFLQMVENQKCGTKEASIVPANGGKSEMRDERRLHCSVNGEKSEMREGSIPKLE
ncbi:hypothetical protein QA612_04565 [Evansella sp. AB-P1]|uniref:hypothetical protein n=1 Tax=Evansella sp. AB-P1 TaxID=3037653 RepID=UPI00241FAD95|nr:hypothetical protein [Evansella sp. AB-P1]MDG5786754.1 hypothetical protein [Evansella sp. AB-P1]